MKTTAEKDMLDGCLMRSEAPVVGRRRVAERQIIKTYFRGEEETLCWLEAVVVLWMMIWLERTRTFPYMKGTKEAAWWANERLADVQPCNLSVFCEYSMVLLSDECAGEG
jgi:hypothetical protein